MNQKFRIKSAALIATIAGTAFGPGQLLPMTFGQSASPGQGVQQVQAYPASGMSASPPIVKGRSSDSPRGQTASGMLAPLAPAAAKTEQAMPWKVDRSKYQEAIAPHAANRSRQTAKPTIRLGATALVPQDVSPRSETPAVAQTADRVPVSPPQAAANQGEQVHQATAQFSANPQAQIAAGFSSAGVPLYTPAPRIARQGSDTRNVIGSGVQTAPAIAAPPMSVNVPFDNQMAPAAPMISADSEMIVGEGSSVLMGPTTYDPAYGASPGQSEYFAPVQEGYSAPIGSDVAVDGGCSTCEASGAVGCGSGGNCNCGPGGCYDESAISMKAGLYGSVGQARQYTHLEGLYFDRRDGDVIFTSGLQLNGFEADGGWRFTLGQRFDAINGREFSYTGTLPISQSTTLDPTVPIDRVFATTDENRAFIAPFGFFNRAVAPVPGVEPRLPGTFGITDPGFPGSLPVEGVPATLNRATAQSHFKETYFHSFELNRVRWGWDVFKSFVGLRYIYVNDTYQINSTNAFLGTATSGTFRMKAMNNMIGPHVGAEWFYDVGYRWSLSLNGKAGVFANFNELDTRLVRGSTAFINADSQNTAFSTALEAGLVAHYQISPRGRFRLGYNVLHLGDLATVSDNLPGFIADVDGNGARAISRGTGSSSSDSDDMTFLGLSFGLELFR